MNYAPPHPHPTTNLCKQKAARGTPPGGWLDELSLEASFHGVHSWCQQAVMGVCFTARPRTPAQQQIGAKQKIEK